MPEARGRHLARGPPGERPSTPRGRASRPAPDDTDPRGPCGGDSRPWRRWGWRFGLSDGSELSRADPGANTGRGSGASRVRAPPGRQTGAPSPPLAGGDGGAPGSPVGQRAPCGQRQRVMLSVSLRGQREAGRWGRSSAWRGPWGGGGGTPG